jgi:sugar-specific transcriptional regulator TrmB
VDVDLLPALGFSARQAAVLAAVCREADTTAGDLAAATGLSRPQVSEALRRLEHDGLVEVHRLQRPFLVSLAHGIDAAVEALLDGCARGRERERHRAEQAAGALRRQAAEIARETYEEVARPNGTSVLFGAHLARSRADRRVLVVGRPPEERRHVLVSRGVAVRSVERPLPVLVVVDGVRARVEVGTLFPGCTGWTFDRPQVEALQQLFALWWDAAA